MQGMKETSAYIRRKWFAAARSGNDKCVAELLKERPELAGEWDTHGTALHYAAEGGREKVVAQLLAAYPGLINERGRDYRTALHLAAREGHDKVVAQLLAVASATLITSADEENMTALSYAADRGHEKVFSQLLAACPELIDRDGFILHTATRKGHDNIVAQIVALRPKILSVNFLGLTALGFAIDHDQQHIAERLFAADPKQVFCQSSTLLHATRKCPLEFVQKLWWVNPRALHVVDRQWGTPFNHAVLYGRNDLIELFQWSLSIDEIVTAFKRRRVSYKERYRPVMEKQCECLLGSVGPDVVSTVLEFLGFERSQNERKSCKRPSPNSLEENCWPFATFARY